MKKTAVLVVLVILGNIAPLYAQTSAAQTEEYQFPQWAKDLRRADIIAFGVFPFAWFFTALAIDLYRSAQDNWKNDGYYPWPATGKNPIPWTNTDYTNAIVIASVTAVTIALTDFLIIRVKRNKAAARKRALTPDAPIIRRTPLEGPPESPPESPPAVSNEGDDNGEMEP